MGTWASGGSVSPPVRRGRTRLQEGQELGRPQRHRFAPGCPTGRSRHPRAESRDPRRSPEKWPEKPSCCPQLGGGRCQPSAGFRRLQLAQGAPPWGLAEEGLLHPHQRPLSRSQAGHCPGPGSEGASGSGHPGAALAGPRSIVGYKGDMAMGLLSRNRICHVYGV